MPVCDKTAFVCAEFIVSYAVADSRGLLVSIGNYVVDAGDLIVGNSNNVLVVPRGEIDAVLPGLEGTAEKEKGLEAEIANGQTCMTLVYKALA